MSDAIIDAPEWPKPTGFVCFAPALREDPGGCGSADHPKIARTAEVELRPLSFFGSGFAGLGKCAAQADDAVRPGKWAFSAVVSGSRAPLGAESMSNGLALRETECITSDDPLPPMARGPSTPRYGHQ